MNNLEHFNQDQFSNPDSGQTSSVTQMARHFIQGALVTTSDRKQAVYNPATGEISKQVALADMQLVNQVVKIAEQAFPAWRDTPVIKRARVMFKFKQLLEENAEKLCELIGQEHGKICHDAQGELQRGIENVEYACGAPEFLKGEYSKNVGPDIDSWSEFQPLGVVAGITPFNFPAMVPLWMFPMAIVCGNCFILKPSEKAPSAALYLAELLQQAGLPDGVFNVVNGDKEAVDALLHHPKIQAISFVGSTPIAEYIYRTATSTGKRCQALGGAKNHAIIMPDADIDNVVTSLLGAAFGSSGERCMALSVAVAIGDEVADVVIAKLKQEMQQLKFGHYADASNDFGPLITQAHKDKVQAYIQSAEQQGAKIVVDGRDAKPVGYENGFFVGPTLIDQISPEMTSYQQEIFGPVLQVIRVETMQEAMQLINEHEYGNGTCIYTRDGEAARYFSNNIQVGMVGINVPLPVPVAYHSFGGWKRSLFGDLYAYGPDGVRFYTRRKTITQRWPSAQIREAKQFAMPTLN
ncbi:methylmalonate-semialdehyde dehydrogenase (acylating) [Acinetobacter sp. ANC 3929]|uniref:CoA-acylating methylmalonate-semialdehyde dehydrogenase n=1 Tax=unclassified Acinetobacter TaxID=196816 RepID=UPI0002D1144A|nr:MULTISPECIES: CoA-acylating methylmalonate-semialdehyde dehydrogenase [unclassified Acinetobacter]ENW81720.1 methylmalonate-semialdehyde dehydrogenase (acylating) [Acinetobacter sp. ANC 3929]MCH7353198.1 CoA-acylating methylmalonate-semialdehyde dehydrogenase [Acinetobacter sp. NIPH 2023]MCH7356879.1 CoA-acylating methylmalonate-semialdehyde dehydrogenase [Acinetobacter sp. NIPH 1958]MCH7360560.1 CoA-acylating methylmalonate-semialdehyde dehydrogenase [Acinetobacter sp. NIPH 2024]